MKGYTKYLLSFVALVISYQLTVPAAEKNYNGNQKKSDIARVVVSDLDGKDIVARYVFQESKTKQPGVFTISLYEVDPNNINDSKLVAYISGFTQKYKNFAYIAIQYVLSDFRQKHYSRLLQSIAFAELARRGYKRAGFKPQQVEAISTEELKAQYARGGAKEITGGMGIKIPAEVADMYSDPEKNPVVNLDQLLLYKLFLSAASLGNLSQVKALIGQGVNPDARADIGEHFGKTALMFAAQEGYDDIVKWLVQEAGADPNLKDVYGRTALMYSAKEGKKPFIKWIVQQAQAKLGQKDNFGETAADYARKAGNEEIADWLESELKQQQQIPSKL